jgi:hypothetical protein
MLADPDLELYLSLFGSVIAYSAYMTLLANTRPEWLAVGIIVLGVTVLVLSRR